MIERSSTNSIHRLAFNGDTIKLYYGAADTSIGLATGSLSALLERLEKNSSAVQQ